MVSARHLAAVVVAAIASSRAVMKFTVASGTCRLLRRVGRIKWGYQRDIYCISNPLVYIKIDIAMLVYLRVYYIYVSLVYLWYTLAN